MDEPPGPDKKIFPQTQTIGQQPPEQESSMEVDTEEVFSLQTIPVNPTPSPVPVPTCSQQPTKSEESFGDWADWGENAADALAVNLSALQFSKRSRKRPSTSNDNYESFIESNTSTSQRPISTNNSPSNSSKSNRLSSAVQNILRKLQEIGSTETIVKSSLQNISDDEIRTCTRVSKCWLSSCYEVLRRRIGNKPFLLLWISDPGKAGYKDDIQPEADIIPALNMQLELYFHHKWIGFKELPDNGGTFPTMEQLEREKVSQTLERVNFVFLFGSLSLESLFLEERRGDLDGICKKFHFNAVYILSHQIIYTTPDLKLKAEFIFIDNLALSSSNKLLQSLCIPMDSNIAIKTFRIPLIGDGAADRIKEINEAFNSIFLQEDDGKVVKALIVLEYQNDISFRHHLHQRLDYETFAGSNLEYQAIGGLFDSFATNENGILSSCSIIRISGTSKVRACAYGVFSKNLVASDFEKMAGFFKVEQKTYNKNQQAMEVEDASSKSSTNNNKFIILFYTKDCNPPMSLINHYFDKIPLIGLKTTTTDGVQFRGFQRILTPNFPSEEPEPILYEPVYFRQEHESKMVFLLISY